jgi:ATP-dependent Clp protease ATP-binding subunit ClpC
MFRKILWIWKNKIENIKKEKNRVVKSQKYEEAAQLRDKEKKLIEQLEGAKSKMGRRDKDQKI